MPRYRAIAKMRATTGIILSAILAIGVHASTIHGKASDASLGTFDTFTDSNCAKGGKGVTINETNVSGELSPEVHSIKAYVPVPCVGEFPFICPTIAPLLCKGS